MDFTTEATTVIRFPSDRQFALYRDEIADRYDSRMVRVQRVSVGPKGTTAEVYHSRGLGAELKGLAYSTFDGSTVRTIYPGE